MHNFTELFTRYLASQGLTPQTIRTYNYQIGIFLLNHPEAENYTYKDIVGYFGEQTTICGSPAYKASILASIKRYYDFLIHLGINDTHPCKRLFLRGAQHRKGIILSDLFTIEELELLTNRTERYKELASKNEIVMSLLVNQALTPGEIANLKAYHVHLDKGALYIKGSHKLSTRHLELLPKQYRLFDIYLNEERPKLASAETQAFLLGKLRNPVTVDDINYIVSTFKPLFADRNLHAGTIRKSVIANWLNEKKLPLEQVQLMAGHKWISTTEAYRQVSVEEQRELINRFDPLG